MGQESGYSGRLYALSGLGDSSGRGRVALNMVGTALAAGSSQLMQANPLRIVLLLVNLDGSNDVYCALGEDAAVVGQGLPLPAGFGWALFNHEIPWTGAIQAIADTANCNVAVVEISLQGTTPEPPSGGGGGGGGSPPPVTKFGKC